MFTLGEDAKETKERIAEAKRELADVGRALLNQKTALDAKNEELEQLESAFTEDCWEQKQKHDEDFADAFKGLRNSREKFRGRVLDELRNSSQVLTPTELQEQAKTVFGDEPEKADVLVPPDTSTLLGCEGDELLTTKIVGKEDVDIAEIVNRLGNSDWVAAGRGYLAESDGLCPFCQQQVPHNLEQDLNDYFDETFLQKTRELDELVRRYDLAVTTLLDELDTVLEADNEFLEARLPELKAHRESLKNLTTGNRQLLERKRQKPSEVVEMASLADESDKMLALIGEVNEKTRQHNTTVDNYQAEKKDLTDKVWKYLIEVELKRTLTKYSSDKKSIQQSVQGIQKKIDATTVARNGLVEEIESLETKTTSVEPTKDAINSLLTNLGFRGFSLEVAPPMGRAICCYVRTALACRTP